MTAPLKSWFSVLLVSISWVATAGAQGERVLSSAHYHLGVAGLPEWEEFAHSTPHGPLLDLPFTAQANTDEHTLFIRQRNVKTPWTVSLNGRKLGALETLVQPLVLALPIPKGALRDGENRLTITRGPSRMLDDIVVGEITLAPQARIAVLTQARVQVTVTASEASENGRELPCRLTLVDPRAALQPLQADHGQRLAVRTGVIYTGDGAASFGVAPGAYTLYASRGFEYSVASETFTIADGETRTVALSLRHEVPTPGHIAADTHIHTLTFSRHGDATVDERMLTIAGEGIELAVATDHNHHVDYSEAAQRSGLQAHFRSVVGNEVSTKVGHFNAFPMPRDGPVPDATLTDWTQLLHQIRSVTGAKVITLNHPRDVHQNFTPLGSANFDSTSGALRGGPRFDFDAIEVVTSAAMQSDIMLLYRDWFALLNHGFRVAAIGASDTHHVSEFILGQSRTYVAARTTAPAEIDLDEVWESFRAGRLLVSLGLLTYIKVDERFEVGDLATGLGPTFQVAVEVRGPSWVTADRVELFANGIKIRERVIASTEKVEKTRIVWTVPRPRHDVHLVAIASGPGVTAPYWEIPRPYQATSKVFTPRVIGSTNPIWIDADADGRFSSARDYAERLVQQQRTGEGAAALEDYDQAVAVQVAHLRTPPAEAAR